MLDDVRYRAGVPSLLILAFFALGLTIGKIVDSDPPNTVNNSEARQATAEIGAPVAPLKAISSDDRIANYTESLAWLTAGLVGVAIFQIWLLVRAESVSSKSASAALAAVDLARDEFNATHRPRIRVRSIIGAREFLGDSEELRPLITLANMNPCDICCVR